MALTPSASFVVSSILGLLTFSGMQMSKPFLISSRLSTILGGLCGSFFFVFLLTAIGNLQIILFGKGFQTKLWEAVISLFLSALLASSVHRVSATTCVLFSLGMLYYMYKISQDFHAPSAYQDQHDKSSKKKK